MAAHIWKIEWTDAMSVGIPEIDEDHKRFVFLVNEFNRAILDRMGLDEIRKRLRQVTDDAVQHFAHEEKLFKQWNYPDADDHARRHAQAVATLRTLKDKFVSYDLESEWIDVGMAVKDLLIDHLITEDMKYSEHYRKAHAQDSRPPAPKSSVL